MDGSEAEKLVGKLKSESSSRVFGALVEVRKKLCKTNEGVRQFRDLGGLECLFALLQKPNSQIMDISMSILANCAMEEETRKKVRHVGGLQVIVNVLQCVGSESILCRACRAVANLAEDERNCAELYNLEAGKNVLSILTSCGRDDTKQMAVRALRTLSDNKKHKQKVILWEGVKAITKLLPTEDANLTREVLKALIVFTSQCSRQCAEQVHGDGSGYEALVSLTSSLNNEFVAKALRCVVNLSVISDERFKLIGASTALVQSLKKDDGTNSSDFVSKVTCLCLLYIDCCNPMRICESGGLKFLIDTLRDPSKHFLKDKIIYALLRSANCEDVLSKCLSLKLVPVLVDFLAKYVEEHSHDHGALLVATEDFPDNFLSNSEDSEMESEEVEASFEEDVQDAPDKTSQTFRVSSPSYQQIQDERLESLQILSSSKDCPQSQWSPASSCSFPETNAMLWSPTNIPCESASSPSNVFSPDASPSTRSFLWSPTSSEMTSWSPIQPSSPRSLNSDDSIKENVNDNEDDRCYSPVEAEMKEEPVEEEVVDHEKLKRSLSVSEPLSEANKSKVIRKSRVLKRSASTPATPTEKLQETESGVSKEEAHVEWILCLLEKFTCMKETHEDLVTAKTWETLLNYLTHTKKPLHKAGRALRLMSRNYRCLVSFLNQRFPTVVYERLCEVRHKFCVVCDELKELGEKLLHDMNHDEICGYVYEVLERHLRVTTGEDRLYVAITILLLIRSRKTLWKLMVHRHALEVIFAALESSQNEMTVTLSLASLSRLAQSLGIEPKFPPAVDADKVIIKGHKRRKGKSTGCLFKSLCLKENVTLVVDSGMKLNANKEMLEKGSEVFAAMLLGGFRESSQSEVYIHEISFDALNYLVHYLYGCSCTSMVVSSGEFMLELVVVADKYLFSDLHRRLSREMLVKFLNKSTFSRIYEWSLMKVLPKCELLFQYFLSGPLMRKDRFAIIQTLQELQCLERFLDELKKFLLEKFDDVRRDFSIWKEMDM